MVGSSRSQQKKSRHARKDDVVALAISRYGRIDPVGRLERNILGKVADLDDGVLILPAGAPRRSGVLLDVFPHETSRMRQEAEHARHRSREVVTIDFLRLLLLRFEARSWVPFILITVLLAVMSSQFAGLGDELR